jgi:outer membrane protein assembly factor BamB
VRRAFAVGILSSLVGLFTGGCASQPSDPAIPDPLWAAPIEEATAFSGLYAADADAGVVVTRYGAEHTDPEGVTVVGDLDEVAAFDLGTGERLWDQDLPSGLLGDEPQVAAGGRLFHFERHETDEAFVDETELVATDLRTGEVVWEHPGLDDSFFELAATADLVIVSTSSQAGEFVDHPIFLDAATGEVLRDDRAFASTDGLRLHTGDDHAFLAAAGQLEAYAGAGAEPDWVAPIGEEVGPYNGLQVRDGVVLVSGDRTATFDLADGTPLATIDATADGGAFRQGRDVVGYDLRTGDERWRLTDDDLGGDVAAVTGISAEVDGAVAILAYGAVRLVDAGSGEELARIEHDEDTLGHYSGVQLTPSAIYYAEVEEAQTFDTGRSALVAARRDGDRIFRVVGPDGLEHLGSAGGVVLVPNGQELVALP